MTPTDKMELQVTEQGDGSATVTVLDDDTPLEEKAEGGSVNDNSEDGETPSNDLADLDPDRQKIREARRQERQMKKQVQRQRIAESQVLINALKRQNEELAHRLASVEQRTSGAELARIDKALEDSHLRHEYAKAKISEAMQAQDGQAMIKAQEMMFEAKRAMEQLSAVKNQMVHHANNPASNIKPPDQAVQQRATNWMRKHDWYDPNLGNTDSKIARNIDEELTKEGWDPATQDYWDELDNRLQQYLPHRFESGNNEYTSTSTSQPRRRAMVTGTGRETTGASRPGEFRLSPERVQAMKDAGIWNDPDKRAKMIKQYATYDRQNRGA